MNLGFPGSLIPVTRTSETTDKSRLQPFTERQRQWTLGIVIQLRTSRLSTCIKRKRRWKNKKEEEEEEEEEEKKEGLYLIP
jgi:hypothetical protein